MWANSGFIRCLKGLKLLNVSYNSLSGNIPSSFGNLESLESLDLSHNQLSGSITETLKKLRELTNLDVSNNQLKGKIPVGGQMDTMNNPEYYANNSGLCGMQIQEPCPTEPPAKREEDENEASFFHWEGVGIGYSAGFFLTVAIMFFTGYFRVSSSPIHSRRRQNGLCSVM